MECAHELGRLFMTGLQAIVRAVIDQRRADQAAALRTAGFVSGYPGSPVATLDREFVRARAQLSQLDVIHRLGVNDELALTAVYGSQLAPTLAGAQYEGVIGVWYGNQPGLDRAHDALKHANYAGTLKSSGAVAIVGDDPAATSSSMPNGSEVAFYDALMPVLYPGDTQAVLDLGRHAINLSLIRAPHRDRAQRAGPVFRRRIRSPRPGASRRSPPSPALSLL
jgi:indolepyruvate ferredoxin oxidoreductase